MFHVKHFRRKQRSLPLPAAQHEESKRSSAEQGACNRGHNPPAKAVTESRANGSEGQTNVSRETFQAREKGKNLANASAMRQPRNTTERGPGATTAKSAKEDHGDCRQLEHGSAPQHKRRGHPQQSGRLRQDARDSKAATAAGHTRAGDRPRRASAADIRGGRGGGTLRTRRAAAGTGRSAVSGRGGARSACRGGVSVAGARCGGAITQEGAVTPRLPY